MVRLRGVSKTYGADAAAVHAVRDVSLDVAAGAFVAVVGPSGSGKSTLLHLIGGLDRATAGQVAVAGTTLSDLGDDELTILRRRRIGIIFQAFNLLPTYTAEANVGLPLRLDGRPPDEVRTRVEQALASVDLLERRRHRPSELSGGEMQRVAIARALAVEPDLILADEPTGNLDSDSGARVLDLVTQAHHERGCTVVLVTHDEQAASRAQRVVTLRDGMLVDDPAGRG